MTLRQLELGFFILLAALLHWLFFVQMPDPGSQSSGVGGEEMVTLIGATQQIETMVADWKRPPEVETAPDQQIQAPVEFEPPPLVEDMVALPELQKPEDLQPPAPDQAMATPEPPPPPPPEPEPEVEPEPVPDTKPQARPAEKAQEASQGQTEQKAAGSGGGAQAGAGTKSVSAGVSPQRQATLVQVWGSKIHAKIARSTRSPSRRVKNATVGVRLRVGTNGELMSVSVFRSSCDATVDKAAVQAVQRARRFVKAPAELTDPSYQFQLMISFN